jgi:hypothetical protein
MMETLYIQYPASEYPFDKSQRIEDISVAFSNDNGCECVVDMDECRPMVARYGAIMNKMIYRQSDLVSYTKNNTELSRLVQSKILDVLLFSVRQSM